jgi:hypothetical protein
MALKFTGQIKADKVCETLLGAGIVMTVVANLPGGNAETLASILSVVGPVTAASGLVIGMVDSLLRS